MTSRLAAALTAFLVCGCAYAANYTLTIDGKDYDIDIGEQQAIKLSDGRVLRVTLSKKAIVSFTAANFSFDHPSGLMPSRTDLGDGVYQTMMASPLGTLVMVQEYETIDPSSLVDLILNELTKEEVEYGYKITKSEASKTLASGATLTGKKAVSTYRDTEYTRYVLSYRSKDSGLLIVSQEEKSIPPEEKQVIELFWKTLKVSMK